jgi:hypothetical protein
MGDDESWTERDSHYIYDLSKMWVKKFHINWKNWDWIRYKWEDSLT